MANEAEQYVCALICIYQFTKNGHHCFLMYTGYFGRIRFKDLKVVVLSNSMYSDTLVTKKQEEW